MVTSLLGVFMGSNEISSKNTNSKNTNKISSTYKYSFKSSLKIYFVKIYFVTLVTVGLVSSNSAWAIDYSKLPPIAIKTVSLKTLNKLSEKEFASFKERQIQALSPYQLNHMDRKLLGRFILHLRG